MDLSKIVSAGTRALGRSGYQLQKFSPEILVGAGIVSVVAAGVLASRASLKLREVNDEYKGHLDVIDHYTETNDDYTEQHRRKDLTHVYRDWGLDLVKLYGPSISLGALGVGSILAGHHILRQRNVALIAAYKVLEKSYSEYRKRVAIEVGEDKEYDIFNGVEKKQLTQKGTSNKTTIATLGPDGGSPYAKFFDQLNPNYKEDAQLNLGFILSVQRFANIRLKAKGIIFLNEIYEDLGFEPTPAGQLVGWIYDSTKGDGYIDFGIDDPRNERARMFIMGDERAVLLDFNVDGIVWDQL